MTSRAIACRLLPMLLLVWSTPEYMGDTASIPHAGNIEAPPGVDHRTLYFSSTHVEPALPRQSRAESEQGIEA
jgi:hypothetical protein